MRPGDFARERQLQFKGLAHIERMGRIINFGIYVACLVGLAACAYVAVAAVAVAPAALGGLAASIARNLLVAIPIVGAAFVLRYKQLTQGASPRRSDIFQFSECPAWMRVACYALMLLGVTVFAWSAALELLGFISPATGAALRVGGFGLVANSFIGAQLYSVQRLVRQLRSRSGGKAARQLAWFS